jgi:hypothetical protein
MALLKLKLNLEDSSREHIAVRIQVENLSDKGCYTSSDIIMLDGFNSRKFKITGPSAIEYEGPYIKYIPETILLEPHIALSKIIVLNDAYNFDDAAGGKYEIKFTTHTWCCEDAHLKDCVGGSIELSDTVYFNLV